MRIQTRLLGVIMDFYETTRAHQIEGYNRRSETEYITETGQATKTVPLSQPTCSRNLRSASYYYNLINNFSIIACGAWRARSCATAQLLTGAQHTLRAGIVRDDRELFHQIIVPNKRLVYHDKHARLSPTFHCHHVDVAMLMLMSIDM